MNIAERLLASIIIALVCTVLAITCSIVIPPIMNIITDILTNISNIICLSGERCQVDIVMAILASSILIAIVAFLVSGYE